MTDIQFGLMMRGQFLQEEYIIVRIVGQHSRAELISV